MPITFKGIVIAVDNINMEVTIIEFVDGIERTRHVKIFLKTTDKDAVIDDMAAIFKQAREVEIRAQVPFDLTQSDLANFNTRINQQ